MRSTRERQMESILLIIHAVDSIFLLKHVASYMIEHAADMREWRLQKAAATLTRKHKRKRVCLSAGEKLQVIIFCVNDRR